MLTIIHPTDPAQSTVTATETTGYVTLAHAGASLTLPTLPRPGNYSDVVYLTDGVLQFEPGALPTIAAVLSSNSGVMSLTLYPLPATNPSAPTPVI